MKVLNSQDTSLLFFLVNRHRVTEQERAKDRPNEHLPPSFISSPSELQLSDIDTAASSPWEQDSEREDHVLGIL